MTPSNTLIVHSRTPLNAEPPTDRLRAAFLTPTPLFYVRSHGDTPTLDPATYRLRVAGRVATELSLSLDDIRRLPARTVVATMQCAGNRRADMARVRPVTGDPWGPGAIGTAEWTGPSLADLLDAAGAAPNARHVAFDGADRCEAGGKSFRYGVSIPMDKARSPEVILAYRMNGEDLRPEHGAPLRALVPGYAGARSPKWLTAVTVADHPSGNPIQTNDYKLFPPDVTAETVDPATGLTIDALPVNSAICEPAPHSTLAPGPTRLRGYATASNRAVARVDVSADGGRTWQGATLEPNPLGPWTWFFWHATIDLASGEHDLAVRAWDDAGQTQPAQPDDTWNYRGYLSAAWHRIPVRVSSEPR